MHTVDFAFGNGLTIKLKTMRPSERLKLAEKSQDAEDTQLTENHNRQILEGGDLAVFQGCVDVVTKFLGTETSASRAGRGTKIGKDIKHLMS